jgi:hypothetical protein
MEASAWSVDGLAGAVSVLDDRFALRLSAHFVEHHGPSVLVLSFEAHVLGYAVWCGEVFCCRFAVHHPKIERRVTLAGRFAYSGTLRPRARYRYA